jgi:hypothetical protein
MSLREARQTEGFSWRRFCSSARMKDATSAHMRTLSSLLHLHRLHYYQCSQPQPHVCHSPLNGNATVRNHHHHHQLQPPPPPPPLSPPTVPLLTTHHHPPAHSCLCPDHPLTTNVRVEGYTCEFKACMGCDTSAEADTSASKKKGKRGRPSKSRKTKADQGESSQYSERLVLRLNGPHGGCLASLQTSQS